MKVKYSNTEQGELTDDNMLKYMAIASDESDDYIWFLNPQWVKEINKRRYMERVNLITYGLNPVVSRFNNFSDSKNTITNTPTGWSMQKIGGSANNTCTCYIFNGDKYFFYIDFYSEKELDLMPVIKLTTGSESYGTLSTYTKIEKDDDNIWYRTSWSSILLKNNITVTIDMTANPSTDTIWISNMGLYNVSRLGMQDMTNEDILAYIDKTKDYIYLDA